MSRAEIERKFDEIVAFAEVEKFLDTPVKRYSSGMYVRLAFAVAAHLEPEILVVDEVLAVGDAAFQKKCMGKMGEVGSAGPHGPVRQPQYGLPSAALRPRCSFAEGWVSADLPIRTAVSYDLRLEKCAAQHLDQRRSLRLREIRLQAIRISMAILRRLRASCHRPAGRFEFELAQPGAVEVAFTIFDDLGIPISTSTCSGWGRWTVPRPPTDRIVCRIAELPPAWQLSRKRMGSREPQHCRPHRSAAPFEVQEGLVCGRRPGGVKTSGKVHIAHKWASSVFSGCEDADAPVSLRPALAADQPQ